MRTDALPAWGYVLGLQRGKDGELQRFDRTVPELSACHSQGVATSPLDGYALIKNLSHGLGEEVDFSRVMTYPSDCSKTKSFGTLLLMRNNTGHQYLTSMVIDRKVN